MGLAWGDLLPDYKASLNDAANVFTGSEVDPDADFKRHLTRAAEALSREKRTRTVMAELTLVAGQSLYEDVPDDLIVTKVSAWPENYVLPWDAPSGPMPSLRCIETATGRAIALTPAPSSAQLAKFGSTYRYYYLAQHFITEEASTSTLAVKDQALLMLRAQVEAMRELSFRGYAKPVTLRGGAGVAGSQQTRNQTPAALWDLLMQEYRDSP